MGVWVAVCRWHRRSGSVAMELQWAEVVDRAAFALVHLGIYRRNPISGLEPEQSHADAFCRMRRMFLPGTVFVKWRSQDWTVLGRNNMRVPVSAGNRFGAAFVGS